jgi:hypothetical protein
MNENETATGTDGSFDTSPTEFARVLRILSANAGRSSVFNGIDMKVENGGAKASLLSWHANKDKSLAVRTKWFFTPVGISEGGFQAATTETWKLLDYLDRGLFAAERPVRFEARPSEGRMYVSGGGHVLQLRTCGFDAVYRIEFGGSDQFGTVAGGYEVFSNHILRPPPDSPWEAWAEKGWVVIHIPRASLDEMLRAAETLTRHDQSAVRFRLTIRDGKLTVVCAEPKNAYGEEFTFDPLDGAVVVGHPRDDSMLLFYKRIAPLLESLRNLHTDKVTFVHWPGDPNRPEGKGTGRAAEASVIVVAGEDGDHNEPVLRVSQVLAVDRDPRAPTA